MKKTTHGWLQPTNVVQVAQSLLKTDKTDFQLMYQQEALAGLRALEETLCQYLLPNNSINLYTKHFIIEVMEQHLQNLMDQTNYLLTLLVPERRVTLAIKNAGPSKKAVKEVDV